MKRYLLPALLLLVISCKKDIEPTLPKTNLAYDKAYEFLEKNIPDSSFVYFNIAKEQFLKTGEYIKVASCLINMAIISGDEGDFFGSQELSLSAIKYLDDTNAKQRQLLSTNYNNLGKMANLLKNYSDADKFYLKSIEFTNKESSKAIYLNNIAINASDQKQYGKALGYFNLLINDKGIREDSRTYPRVLSNISETRWLQNSNYNAAPDFLKALYIRIKEKDTWGQNASYSHLANYYAKKQPDSGLFYAKKMYEVAKQIESANDQLEALQKLIKLSPPTNAKQYFDRYQTLNDSVQTARSKAKNQFALIRFETEKSKADNMVLQDDNRNKNYQIFILIAGLFLVIIFGTVWFRNRRKRLALQAENEIRENKLRTSKKVHDVVANGLYRLMAEVQNNPTMDKEDLLDDIEFLYEKSRDISYDEDAESHTVAFDVQIDGIINSFKNEQIEIDVLGNDASIWVSVNTETKHELEHIIQELMVNMNKHSKARMVIWRFEKLQDHVNIVYIDNGIGLAHNIDFKNGLTNTGNRIKSIGGKITFENITEKGLKVTISFPTN